MAAPFGEDPAPIFPAGPSHTVQTATRRAVATLRDHQLIVVRSAVRLTPDDPDPEVAKVLAMLRRKFAVLRLAERTPLGEQVVQQYRQELETEHARIRWQTGKLDQVREDTLALCPQRR